MLCVLGSPIQNFQILRTTVGCRSTQLTLSYLADKRAEAGVISACCLAGQIKSAAAVMQRDRHMMEWHLQQRLNASE